MLCTPRSQTKCVRYYMAFARALALMKRVLAAQGRAYDAASAPGGPRPSPPLPLLIQRAAFLPASRELHTRSHL